mmetsp:Transcript_107710/g.347675  ORF Transcript_107710/g.347675 Transcript_107710/m.347675 type:complete len:361 (+) Transcript_107710:877-1959(+)
MRHGPWRARSAREPRLPPARPHRLAAPACPCGRARASPKLERAPWVSPQPFAVLVLMHPNTLRSWAPQRAKLLQAPHLVLQGQPQHRRRAMPRARAAPTLTGSRRSWGQPLGQAGQLPLAHALSSRRTWVGLPGQGQCQNLLLPRLPIKLRKGRPDHSARPAADLQHPGGNHQSKMQSAAQTRWVASHLVSGMTLTPIMPCGLRRLRRIWRQLLVLVRDRPWWSFLRSWHSCRVGLSPSLRISQKSSSPGSRPRLAARRDLKACLPLPPPTQCLWCHHLHGMVAAAQGLPFLRGLDTTTGCIGQCGETPTLMQRLLVAAMTLWRMIWDPSSPMPWAMLRLAMVLPTRPGLRTSITCATKF